MALDVEDGLTSELGLQVHTVHNLSAATAAAQRHEFDYALLDLNLGNGERSTDLGLALADRGVHVVFASGYNRNEIREIDDFLLIEKPFRISDVAQAFDLPVTRN
ncbi:hypothetical protein [Salipiger sp. IMCC34102]|uniref:hypothetical protein n=1 Tax=Salipiger sp. IMCC34102 TaxID=2510647 RepID=UPI0013ED634F|nr:hypothetical protein [Salipiger sp. IMCC34102]